MLYVIYGTDTKKTGAHAAKMIAALAKKRPDASIFSITPENYSSALLDEYIGSVGLFETKHIIKLDGLLADVVEADVLDRVSDMAENEHIFIMREEKLLAAQKKKLEKYAEEVREFALPENKQRTFNVFALADAVGSRDKKKAWSLYQDALREGLVAEEIHGTLWWQVKTMLQVARGDTEGLKPFSITKAKGFLKKHSPEQLRVLASALVETYHEARRGNAEMEIGIEKILLEL